MAFGSCNLRNSLSHPVSRFRLTQSSAELSSGDTASVGLWAVGEFVLKFGLQQSVMLCSFYLLLIQPEQKFSALWGFRPLETPRPGRSREEFGKDRICRQNLERVLTSAAAPGWLHTQISWPLLPQVNSMLILGGRYKVLWLPGPLDGTSVYLTEVSLSCASFLKDFPGISQLT